MTNRGLQGGAFRKDTTPGRRHRPTRESRVSHEATRRAMMVATTPSGRERVSPPPVRPKIEQVFTPANTHRHRTPHPGDHAAHTTMVTGQHPGTGFAHEHRDTITRAAAPASKTSTPPHQLPSATPPIETGGKAPPFAPLSCPQPAAIGPSCCRARD